jgi:hypothetical protein
MYAIVNKGNGESYTSYVYACYEDKRKRGSKEWGRYYVVLNENKTALVKHYSFECKVLPTLHSMIMITDCNYDNWNVDEKTGFGEVNITNKESLLNMIKCGTISDELLSLDKAYCFVAYPEINSKDDIENLMCVSGYFHDAYIKDFEEKDGELYVLFDGVWGGKIEMWFSGDVKYDISSRNPEEYDPYWFGSQMVIVDGFIYFVDDEDVNIEDIGHGYCWFKSRYVKYHVIAE